MPKDTNISLDDFAEEDEQISSLKKVNLSLMRQLAEAKSKKQDYVNAVYEAVKEALTSIDIKPVKAPKLDKRSEKEEVAVALVSDLQLAKVTPDYNSEVCAQRMELYAQKIIKLTEVQRADHPVRKCVVTFLGDIIEGVEIFPGQQWLIDAGLYRQIMVTGPEIVIGFLRTLLTVFDSIEVVWVIGNHGRIGRKGDFDPETNGDRMLGRLVMMMLENEKRITWTLPEGQGERNWYAIARVGNYSALCIHGDQIRGALGFPWYGLGKKVNPWAAGVIREPFKDVFMGHHHQRSLIPLNTRNVYANGSTESYNTFAQENMASMSDPSQWLLFVDPEKGRVTASYGVDLY